MFGSDLEKLHRCGELLEREIIAEEFDNGLPRVIEMIAKEVDDEGEREQQ